MIVVNHMHSRTYFRYDNNCVTLLRNTPPQVGQTAVLAFQLNGDFGHQAQVDVGTRQGRVRRNEARGSSHELDDTNSLLSKRKDKAVFRLTCIRKFETARSASTEYLIQQLRRTLGRLQTASVLAERMEIWAASTALLNPKEWSM